jgi:hypothetical protein
MGRYSILLAAHSNLKTTIELSDALLLRAKRAALERGTTLRALIEEALERAVGGTGKRATPLRTITFGVPGAALLDARDLGASAHPDTDDPGYVAKRLGLAQSARRRRGAPD